MARSFHMRSRLRATWFRAGCRPLRSGIAARRARGCGARHTPAFDEAAARLLAKNRASARAGRVRRSGARIVRVAVRRGTHSRARALRRADAGRPVARVALCLPAERKVANDPGMPADVTAAAIRKAAVIGAGTMGSGIAMCFANAGIPVVLVDSTHEALDRGFDAAARNYATSVKRGSLSADAAEHALSRITRSTEFRRHRRCRRRHRSGVRGDGGQAGGVRASTRSPSPVRCWRRTPRRSTSTRSPARRSVRRRDRHAFLQPGERDAAARGGPRRETSWPTIATTARGRAADREGGGAVGRTATGSSATGCCPPYRREAASVAGGRHPGARSTRRSRNSDGDGSVPTSRSGGSDVGCAQRRRPGRRTCATRGSPTCSARTAGSDRRPPPATTATSPAAAPRSPIPWSSRSSACAVEDGIERREIGDAEIVDRCILALVNEGAKILGEGIAQRASDIDVVYVDGYGLPASRGGPMYYAERLGLAVIRDRLANYAQRSGDATLQPAPLLAERAAAGKDSSPRRSGDGAQQHSIRVDRTRSTRFNWSDHLTRTPRSVVQNGARWPLKSMEETMRDPVRAALRCVAAAAFVLSFDSGRAGTDYAARRRPVQRRPRVQPRAREVPGAYRQVLRQAGQLRPAQEQRARPREGLFRVHEPGDLGRLRDRVARAYVDVLQGGALHRRAVPVPRPRPLEQGARRRHAEAGRRRGGGERRGDADRLRRRRHAQHLRQQAGAQPGRDEGTQGPRAGRADLEQDVRRDRHVADGHRVRRDLQRDPERRDPGRRERGGGRRGDEILRGRPEPQYDAARHHDPADLLFGEDVQEAAARPAGRRFSRPARRRASSAARSNRAPTRKSSSRWRRPASSSGSRSPTARR